MIGIDLVQIAEFKKQLQNGGQAFLDRAFNQPELVDNSTEALAGIWAAKEAVFKAADKQPDNFKSILIVHTAEGRPQAWLGEEQFYISIAHHGDYAVAAATRKTQS